MPRVVKRLFDKGLVTLSPTGEIIPAPSAPSEIVMWFVRVFDQLWRCKSCKVQRAWGLGYRPREVAVDGYIPLLVCRGSCGKSTRHEYLGVATSEAQSWPNLGDQSMSVSQPAV